MSTDVPDRPPILGVLRVRRNVAIGATVGISVAVLAYVYRVIIVDPAPGAVTSPWLFGALAFVLAVTLGGLVAIALTLGTAIRRARQDDLDRPDE